MLPNDREPSNPIKFQIIYHIQSVPKPLGTCWSCWSNPRISALTAKLALSRGERLVSFEFDLCSICGRPLMILNRLCSPVWFGKLNFCKLSMSFSKPLKSKSQEVLTRNTAMLLFDHMTSQWRSNLIGREKREKRPISVKRMIHDESFKLNIIITIFKGHPILVWSFNLYSVYYTAFCWGERVNKL